jgi:nucleoside phosphorylase
MRPEQVDFVVVTALPLERDAVLGILVGVEETQNAAIDIRTYHVGSIDDYRVAVALSLKPGNVNAALVANDAIQMWDPRYLVMLGIAGGFPRDGLDICDVVFADQVIEVDYAKVGQMTDTRWRAHGVDALMLDRARAISGWGVTVGTPLPLPGRSRPPRLFIGPVATGSKVVANRRARDQLLHVHSRLLAVEMESGGIAVAAWERRVPRPLIVIRGISDLSDEQKSDGYQSTAAQAAATFFFDLLRARPIEPDPDRQKRTFELGRDSANIKRFYK